LSISRIIVRALSYATVRQSLVFGVVGAVLAGVYFVVAYAGSTILHLEPEIASGLTYVLMIPPAYYAHRLITFQSEGLHRVALPRFVVTSFIGTVLSYAVPYWAVRRLGVPDWVTFLMVCVVVPAFSFVAMRLWVFAVGHAPSR
jgi:putative flippase GtrA